MFSSPYSNYGIDEPPGCPGLVIYRKPSKLLLRFVVCVLDH